MAPKEKPAPENPIPQPMRLSDGRIVYVGLTSFAPAVTTTSSSLLNGLNLAESSSAATQSEPEKSEDE